MHLTQIGVIHTPFRHATGTPIQPYSAGETRGTVVLEAPYMDGLLDLAGFDRIWLLYWLDRVTAAQMHVIPYRDTQPHGIFATRAPARPNPIGLSPVRLLSIDGAVLHIAEVDILDGTPLLDIKPYIADYDSYPQQRRGWLDNPTAQHGPLIADNRFERQA